MRSYFQSANITINHGIATFADSDTISWTYSGGQIQAQLASGLYNHQYSITPTKVSSYIYSLPASATYASGTLRVYINGIRLVESANLLTPTLIGTPMTLNSYAETTSNTFTLYAALASADVIRVDFDQEI